MEPTTTTRPESPSPAEGDSSGEEAAQGALRPGAGAGKAGRPRRSTRTDNPLVRTVGRIPVRARTKLLAAFLGTVVLLVVVVALGLRALGQSNARVERPGGLHLRAAGYRELQTEAA